MMAETPTEKVQLYELEKVTPMREPGELVARPATWRLIVWGPDWKERAYIEAAVESHDRELLIDWVHNNYPNAKSQESLNEIPSWWA